MELLFSFLAIIALFVFALALQHFLHLKKWCSLCVAVSGTWIMLLLLSRLGFFSNATIIALLMGQSVIGLFYLAEKKVEKKLLVFRLPFLLTLTFIAALLISALADLIVVLLLLIVVWLFFLWLYLYANNSRIKNVTRKIIECCKRW